MLMEKIFDSQKLRDVPKLIICQFCRGEKEIKSSFYTDTSGSPPPKKNKQCDTMYFFATMSGTVALRCGKDGSPFIHAFCRAFVSEDNVLTMTTKINAFLSQHRFPLKHRKETGVYLQLSANTNYLLKELIFED